MRVHGAYLPTYLPEDVLVEVEEGLLPLLAEVLVTDLLQVVWVPGS